jgi:hypothetical protein
MTDNNSDDEEDPSFITGPALERHFELQSALLEFANLFRDEANDRALAIVGATFLDTQLEHVARAFLVEDASEVDKLLSYDQPLGTFGNRIRTAYCLGLISKTIRDDLRLVAKIRNRFAHDLVCSFDSDPIRSWAIELKWHRKAYMTPPPGVSPRDLFNVGVNQLVGHLDGLISLARLDKRRNRD